MAGAGRLISSFPAGGVPSTLPGKPATDSIDRRWKSDAKRHDTSREEPCDEGARHWSSTRLPGAAPSGGEGGRTNGVAPRQAGGGGDLVGAPETGRRGHPSVHRAEEDLG